MQRGFGGPSEEARITLTRPPLHHYYYLLCLNLALGGVMFWRSAREFAGLSRLRYTYQLKLRQLSVSIVQWQRVCCEGLDTNLLIVLLKQRLWELQKVDIMEAT